MFRALYDWVLRLAEHRHANRALFAISFAESSFFPIPPDVMMIPMILAKRERAFRIAALCTLASVLGGIFGYAIGAFLWESVGKWVIDLYHLETKMETLRTLYNEWGAVVTLTAGVTPLPFKLFTIANGVFAFNFPLFVVLAIVGRGIRFFLVAALLKRFGAPVQEFVEKRLNLFGWLFVVLLIGGFALISLF
ncbi:YqaA family protein [Stakelama tenebrarum]|uniref:DedA family protein n=1 Tax=Stakelama tenebrarum TaxID=2711215 RepID=A0A6G6Y4P3_9SPHN|nr:YqaA family protein [Sphingosinithalassobacter tenebrarum]QIG79777.1 DedA family protein [Sphingosinithalassobacter tenebrarum]